MPTAGSQAPGASASATSPSGAKQPEDLGSALQAFLTQFNAGGGTGLGPQGRLRDQASNGSAGSGAAASPSLAQLLPPGARPWAPPRPTQPGGPPASQPGQRKPLPSRSAARTGATAGPPSTPGGQATGSLAALSPPATLAGPRAAAGLPPRDHQKQPAPGQEVDLRSPRPQGRPQAGEGSSPAPRHPRAMPGHGPLARPQAPVASRPPGTGTSRPAPSPAPGLAPASVLVASPARRWPPKATAVVGGALAVAVALVTALAWGAGTNGTLAQRTQQLASANDELATARQQLAQARQYARYLEQSLQSLGARYKAASGHLAVAESELRGTNARLGSALTEVGQANKQLTAAKGQFAAAEQRLGQARRDLSASRWEAAQCRYAAVLGQRDTQLLSFFVQQDNLFLSALQAHDRAGLSADLSQMRNLASQAQALGPQFVASFDRCSGA